MQGVSPNKMKNEIEKNDFEIYSFYIPMKIFFSRRKESFIINQLGKMHPCFSDDWEYFTKYVFTKKGIFAYAVVINKMVFVEYKKKYMRKLYVIHDGKRIIINKYKKKNYICFLIFFLIVISIFVSFLFRKNKVSKELKIEESKIIENDLCKENVSIIEDLLPLVSEKKGKIRFISIETNETGEKIDFSVEGIFPEVLDIKDATLEIKNITFKNNRPSFEGHIYRRMLSIKKIRNNNEFLKQMKTELRNLLISKGLNLLEEGDYPFNISFNYPLEKDFVNKETFLLVGGIINKYKCCLSKLLIKKTEENKVFCQIWIENFFDPMSEKKLALMEEYLYDIFFKEAVKKKEFGKNEQVINDKKNQKRIEKRNEIEMDNRNKGQKIGVIKKTNGSNVLIYKSETGKINFINE